MKPLVISICIVFGCGQKRDPFPYTVQSDESSDVEEGEEDGPVRPDCVDTWAILADGTTIQPELCLLWSPPSEDSMSWYEAASIEDGEAGGCGSDCPDGGGHEKGSRPGREGYLIGQEWEILEVSETWW